MNALLSFLAIGYVLASVGLLRFSLDNRARSQHTDAADFFDRPASIPMLFVAAFGWPVWVPLVLALVLVGFIANGIWEVL